MLTDSFRSRRFKYSMDEITDMQKHAFIKKIMLCYQTVIATTTKVDKTTKVLAC
jgi:hypothetical protein